MQRLYMLNLVIVRKTRREESRQKHDGIKMDSMGINFIPSWIRRTLFCSSGLHGELIFDHVFGNIHFGICKDLIHKFTIVCPSPSRVTRILSFSSSITSFPYTFAGRYYIIVGWINYKKKI